MSEEPDSPAGVLATLRHAQCRSLEAALGGEAEVLPYPWDGLDLSGRQCLLGFGSLLNPDSARKTIPTTPPEGHPPCVAFGVERLFNYEMSRGGLRRHGAPVDPRALAALNARVTGNRADLINARVISLAADFLPALRAREFGYDLCRIPFLPWPLVSGAEVACAWVLCAPEGAEVVNNDLLPNPHYVDVCLAGAQRVSAPFADLFTRTSRLADGRSLAEWRGDDSFKG